jgi:hypothetical protein
MAVAKKAVAKKIANTGGMRPAAKQTVKPAAKRPVGVYPKGPGVSNINPDAPRGAANNRKNYIDAVQTIRETSETRKDVSQAVSMIAAAGRKYKQDSTKDIASWKKFVTKITPKDADKRWR